MDRAWVERRRATRQVSMERSGLHFQALLAADKCLLFGSAASKSLKIKSNPDLKKPER